MFTKLQTAGIKFTHRSKISIFAHAGATRCTNSSEIWHSQGAHGSAWPCKISRQSMPRDGNAAPKMAKISTFW